MGKRHFEGWKRHSKCIQSPKSIQGSVAKAGGADELIGLEIPDYEYIIVSRPYPRASEESVALVAPQPYETAGHELELFTFFFFFLKYTFARIGIMLHKVLGVSSPAGYRVGGLSRNAIPYTSSRE